MGKKDKRWVLQRKKDLYYRLAKKNKYRSRASYKLLQLNEKFNVIKPNDVVVDLGCAPGGWLQVCRKLVGDGGYVVGVDLQSVKPLGYDNVVAIRGDMTKRETILKLKELMPKKYADVVVCDASPNISGVWERDHTKSLELTLMALIASTKLLKKGGNFVVKVFQGSLFDKYVQLLKEYFEKVYTTKPRASRDVSAEVYVIGKRYLGKPFIMDKKYSILKLLDDDKLDILKDSEDNNENNILNNDISREKEGLLIKKIKELRKNKNELKQD